MLNLLPALLGSVLSAEDLQALSDHWAEHGVPAALSSRCARDSSAHVPASQWRIICDIPEDPDHDVDSAGWGRCSGSWSLQPCSGDRQPDGTGRTELALGLRRGGDAHVVLAPRRCHRRCCVPQAGRAGPGSGNPVARRVHGPAGTPGPRTLRSACRCSRPWGRSRICRRASSAVRLYLTSNT